MKFYKYVLTLALVFIMVFTVACTPSETKQLEGIIQNVDSVNGEVTIVTEDGETITVTITTDTSLESDGNAASLDQLEAGVSIEVEVNEDSQVVDQITARDVEKKLGTLQINVTDPPPADVEKAIVYLTNIEVHKANAEQEQEQEESQSGDDEQTQEQEQEQSQDTESGWFTVLEAPPSFDLMAVIDIEDVLGSANILTGKYTQIRMEVSSVEVTTTDGEQFTANVPSNKLKIVGSFEIEAGTTTILTLDFDGQKSLVVTGNGEAHFKPVVKLFIRDKDKTESED
ncbi:DUF4382 domain-containing protein, partial [Chloroflexota bacterium]